LVSGDRDFVVGEMRFEVAFQKQKEILVLQSESKAGNQKGRAKLI